MDQQEWAKAQNRTSVVVLPHLNEVVCYSWSYILQFQVRKMELLTYVSCMDTAYVREKPPPK